MNDPEYASRRDAIREAVKAALAAGATYREAAAAVPGSSVRSIARWMTEDPGFVREVSALRFEQVSVVSGLLSTMTIDAMAVLADAMLSEDTGDRLKAAALVLQWASRWRSQFDLETRLAELECRLAGGHQVDEVEL